MYEKINASSLLIRNKQPSQWFDIAWNFNIYRGCPHACIYCDSRADCYQVGDFERLKVKVNALELLNEELSGKRHKATIGTGSMSDPYNPFEKDLKLTRGALAILAQKGFPLHLNTKGDMLVRDLDLFQEINFHSFCSIAFSFTTCDDELAAKLEPFAPLPSKRLKAMAELTKNGIYCGALFTPMLPFITDNEHNIINSLQQIADSGASYAFSWFALSLKKGVREHYLGALTALFPTEAERFVQHFGNRSECQTPRYNHISEFFGDTCIQLGLKYRMQDIQSYEKNLAAEQLTIF